jgi:hypothetical protein
MSRRELIKWHHLFAALAVVALLTVVATTAGCATNTNPSLTPNLKNICRPSENSRSSKIPAVGQSV